MFCVLLCLVVGLGDKSKDVRHAELMELNHCYSWNGDHKFDQVILWDWSPEYRRWDAQFWVIVKDMDCPVEVAPGCHEFRYWSGDRRVVIRSPLYRETWTASDPERESAKLFPAECRSKRFCCSR